MSILIRGMEMPTRCFSCPMCDVENAEVNCAISHGSYIEYREVDPKVAIQGRPSDCPLIEVPPHGRLIDADALLEVFDEGYNDSTWWFESKVEDAPTVIPSDKDGER